MGHMHIYGHVLRFSTQAFARAGTETPQGPRENWLRLVSRGSAKKVVCRRLKPMKLFIGNLPSETTPEDLLQIFDDFAPNHAHVVTTFGRPFGFGFVHIDEVVVNWQFTNSMEATSAVGACASRSRADRREDETGEELRE
jgi:RNA recognition motif